MSNPYYTRGANFEREIMQQLKDEGYEISLRSSGSHTPIDVVGLHWEDGWKVRLVQAKYINDEKDLKKYAKLKEPNIEMWIKVKGKGVTVLV